MPAPSEHTPPLFSEFANDPDMQELVEMFVSELPERVDGIVSAFDGHKIDDLKRMAHQLKGAGGGYGFPTIGEAAGNLESSLGRLDDRGEASNVEQITSQVNELVKLCNRASAGTR